ncbi:MAG: response regulator transcription factor [Nitrospiraceae bacterium]
MKLLRLILADDHALLLDAFKHLLHADYDVVGTAMNGQELVTSAIQLKPDIIIADVAMPIQNGLDAVGRVRKLLPQTKIIILTAIEDPDLAERALSSGVSGYLLKSSASAELFDALRAVSAGRQYVTRSIVKKLEEVAASGRKLRSSGRELSPRQRQVLQLLAEGRTMKEAAAALGLTPRTVAFHKYQVMHLFQLKSTADLVQFAINEQLISNRRQPCQL